MNQGLSRLSEWFDANYKLINNAKTQALLIGPCKYDFDLTLNVSGVNKLPSIRIQKHCSQTISIAVHPGPWNLIAMLNFRIYFDWNSHALFLGHDQSPQARKSRTLLNMLLACANQLFTIFII